MQKFFGKKSIIISTISIYAFLMQCLIAVNILRPVFSYKFAGTVQHNLDYSIINTFIYFEAWFDLITTIWAITKFINLFRSDLNKIQWVEKNNIVTMIATYALIDFIINLLTVSFQRDINEYNSWAIIIKSVMQHWVLPVYLFIFCLSIQSNKYVDLKLFIKKYSWKILIIPTIYILYIYIRYYMLKNHSFDYQYQYSFSDGAMIKLDASKNGGQLLKLFPYSRKPVSGSWLVVCVITSIITIFSTFWVSYGFNLLSNNIRNWKFWDNTKDAKNINDINSSNNQI